VQNSHIVWLFAFSSVWSRVLSVYFKLAIKLQKESHGELRTRKEQLRG